ncbi:hypothetical protein [Pedobacter glucosidilyticus]|uniref:hypothetical protein n=1 Tax=Pedobacter glucosidilyticus TaxID=1122941 RepID=UPI0026F18E06|nr:hypothetical protein [Pedobacter glucosidilyticus]
MDLKKYIETLEGFKPSEELLKKNGFKSIPNYILRNYSPQPKGNEKIFDIEETDLSKLFQYYDLSYFRFSDFILLSEIINKDNKFVFAQSSYTFLAFDSLQSEVIEYDNYELTKLSYCARNIDSFLNALLPIFEMYSQRLQNLADTNDEIKNMFFLEQCVINAGGDKYKRFFEQIIF